MKDIQTPPVVRALRQFGRMPKSPISVRLFLDDARNPPLDERDWVVVRNVADAVVFVDNFSHLITEVSLDNDLGADPQGYQFLEWLLSEHCEHGHRFPLLRKFTIHTGNMPKWRLMIRMLRGKPFEVVRRVPFDRVYPRASDDRRKVPVYKGSTQ